MDTASAPPGGRIAVPLLGIAQIVSWGSSFYLLAVLPAPISDSPVYRNRKRDAQEATAPT